MSFGEFTCRGCGRHFNRTTPPDEAREEFENRVGRPVDESVDGEVCMGCWDKMYNEEKREPEESTIAVRFGSQDDVALAYMHVVRAQARPGETVKGTSTRGILQTRLRAVFDSASWPVSVNLTPTQAAYLVRDLEQVDHLKLELKYLVIHVYENLGRWFFNRKDEVGLSGAGERFRMACIESFADAMDKKMMGDLEEDDG